MKRKKQALPLPSRRQGVRFPHLRELSLSYEGCSEDIVVRPPDISLHGMFINTSTRFPEGSVLKLRFRLTRSGTEIITRSEVRFCLPGVGIGVEFLDLQPEHVRDIEKEIVPKSGARRQNRKPNAAKDRGKPVP